MNTAPTPAQQSAVDAINTALRAQDGETTLSPQESPGQLDMTILSPNQPFKVTIDADGTLAEFAFFDASEENCEPDGTITQGRWIDAEPASEVTEALRRIVRAAADHQTPETPAQKALRTLSDQLLDLSENNAGHLTPADAFKQAAALVRDTTRTLPAAISQEIPEDLDYIPAAELRAMFGLPKLPPIVVDEELTEALAREFYMLRPEKDARQRNVAWGWSSWEGRQAQLGNANRVLSAIINGEDPYDVPFTGVPLRSVHVEAAKYLLAQAPAAGKVA